MQTTKEYIDAELFNKIPNSAAIAIYGTNNISSGIFKDILSERKDIDIKCFLDKQNAESFENRDVYSLKEFITKDLGIDLVILTTNDVYVENILDVYDFQFITVTGFFTDYYAGKHKILNEANYQEVINIFKDDEDKALFDIIFRRRKRFDNDRFLAQHYDKNYKTKLSANRTIKNQYLEKINKDNVRVIFDLGFNSGFNTIAYDKLLPNLKKIYAFEAIYDICRNSFVEDFFPKNKITIVPAAVGETKSKTKFYINSSNPNASMINFSNSFPDKHITGTTHRIADVDVITIDYYCKTNNIKPDFIKMDIEGAELPAIKGGLDTIKSCRPQMAISIYHCDNDFINIPKYLHQNLENYSFKLGHYSPDINETVLYALPKE